MNTTPDLSALAGQIKTDLDRFQRNKDVRERNDSEWSAIALDLCIHLAQARGKFDSNKAFHDWLVENKLDVEKNDRAAAVAMGKHPEVTKTVLEQTKSRSLRLIHLEEFRIPTDGNTEPEEVKLKKDGTPRQRAGRKKGETKAAPKSRRGKKMPKLDEARKIVRAKLEADEPISPHKLEKEHGISHVTFDMAITAELARKEAEADQPIDASTLSMSAQEKLEIAKRQQQKAWEREKEELIRLAALKLIEELLLPHWKEKFDRAERIEKMLSKRRGLMSEANYKTILACLHPDNSASTTKRNEAFRLFSELKDYLVTPAGLSPNSPKTFPSNVKEMMAQAAAMREAARKAASTRKEKSNGAEAT